MTVRQARGTVNGAGGRLPQTDVVRTVIAPFCACARFSQWGRKFGCADVRKRTPAWLEYPQYFGTPHCLVKFYHFP
jgi:hypothetical protein